MRTSPQTKTMTEQSARATEVEVGVLTAKETTNVKLLREPGHGVLSAQVGKVEKGAEHVVVVSCEVEVFSDSKDRSI
jgi:hypothetical protein